MKWLALVLVAACSSEPGEPDANTATLTIELSSGYSRDVRVSGNGLDCSTSSCSGGDVCSVSLPVGTSVQLTVQHPVCPDPNQALYFGFGFTPKLCVDSTNRTCNFEFWLASDVTLTITGLIAVD